MQLSVRFQIFLRTGNSPRGFGMTVLMAHASASFVCCYTHPQGVGREKSRRQDQCSRKHSHANKNFLRQRSFRDTERFSFRVILAGAEFKK